MSSGGPGEGPGQWGRVEGSLDTGKKLKAIGFLIFINSFGPTGVLVTYHFWPAGRPCKKETSPCPT